MPELPIERDSFRLVARSWQTMGRTRFGLAFAVAQVVIALLGGSAFAQTSGPRLPLRNLLVELRQGDEASLRGSSAGIESGAVVLGSDGSVSGRAAVGAEARSRDAAHQSSQRLTVLNGGRGSLRVGSAQPLQWLQIGWTAQGPAVVGLGTQWVDSGRGFVVQPRWPGGDAPVTIEVQAEASSMTAGGGVAGAGMLTTLTLPMNEWVTVAESGESESRQQRGLASTRELARSRSFVVQMRVSAP